METVSIIADLERGVCGDLDEWRPRPSSQHWSTWSSNDSCNRARSPAAASSREGHGGDMINKIPPNIVITPPSLMAALPRAIVPVIRAIEPPETMVMGVPFPLSTPPPTHPRNDMCASVEHVALVTQAATAPQAAYYAPARSSLPRTTRPHLKSFHTDSTGCCIEVPRFKRRHLNLAIIRRYGAWDYVMWGIYWILCVLHGLVLVFFDVNVFYMLVQVVRFPPYQTDARHLWIFATVGYGVCWLISILGVWLGWELWYNFWRNWGRRLPAIEPIYFSLSASTHLSLASFDHFNFLLHTRLSPLGTHHATDIIPETAYLVTQLAPGLLPLGVRACIAGILLLSFWRPEALVPITAANPLASASRDPNFFDPNHVGQLMPYAKAVLLTFVGWVGLRVVLVALSGLVLWVFSFHSTSDSGSGTCVDPADWNSPATSWRDEAEFQWGWRERARARIQNAFELCIVRPRYAEPEKILAEEPASTEFIPVQPYESEPCSPVEAYVPAEAYSPAEPYSPIEPYPEVNTGVVAPAYNAYEINVGRDLQGAALHNSIVYQEALVEDELPRTLRYSQKRVPVPKITSSDCDFGPVYPTRSTDTAASGATSASVWAARFRTERNSLPARPYSDGDKYTHVYEPEFGALGARSHSSTLQSTQGLGYSRTRYRPTSALDDLASLKHFMDREATPSPQFQGGLAWIRFKAASRVGEGYAGFGLAYPSSTVGSVAASAAGSRSGSASASGSGSASSRLSARSRFDPSPRIRATGTATPATILPPAPASAHPRPPPPAHDPTLPPSPPASTRSSVEHMPPIPQYPPTIPQYPPTEVTS